ncbi:MAG TPA: ATP-binding protein, partial [Xanthobacteraceae bacterium]|nr:ATP-binding protein [Xanthobacteraceae bacterium]
NAMLADIRERDSRLEAHRRNLEQEVAERTRDLRDARDVAETANRAKSEFLATMSHEIRTPMNGIMVMAELLASGDMPARQRRYAEVIAHSGQSLLAIINDILDVSKIESGKLELESVRLDVAELAETAVTLFAERARSKNIDLAALVDPAAPRTIVGDPVRLTQIVTNLVNNALKFTERGFVRLTIGPARDGFIAIAVEDTGIGIAPEKIERIFDAFAQADQSTTRQFGGTGLGLAICKKLTSAMGGRIDVASTVGSGSTFAISIPTGDVEYRAWPRLDLGFGGAGYCILNLDGAATVATAARYLAAFGYVVLPADERLASTEYDKASLVCVDADKLPALQLGPRGQRNSIVIAVAHLGDERADRLLADGLADAVVAKPILRSEVEDILACIAAGQPILSAREAASTSATRQFPGLKVLVADDSAVNREVALEALSRLGAATTTVENGREAIAAVEATAFDVVLMDGSMPEIDGFTAAREIRAREVAEGRKRLPIIALTAHVVGTTANAWRDAGMDDVIYKPYTLAQLAGCFARLFPEWAGADAPSISSRVGAPVAAADRIEAQLLDTSMLDDLQAIARGGKQEFLARIFRLYRENAARARDELVSAAQAQDHETCGRLAHALKSMSYNIGAMQVAAHAEAIERQAREDARFPDATQLEALLSSLDATFALIAARSDRASSEEPAARADRSRA